MAWRFRKSISLGKGLKLNINKKSVGFSAGVKGLHVGANTTRGAFNSVGIPGTGLYAINYAGKGSKSSHPSSADSALSLHGFLTLMLVALCLISIYNSPIFGITFSILVIIIYAIWSKQPKQQARAKFLKAMGLFNKQKYEEAVILLKEAITLDKTNYDIVRLLGGALNNSKKYEEAIDYIKDFLNVNPTDIGMQVALASCLYNTDRYSEAIGLLQKLPKEVELDLKVIQLLGGCFAAQKHYDLAINVFKKAPLLKRNLDADLIELHYNLAQVYEDSGDKRNALKHFKKVYSEDADYRDVAEKLKKLEK